MKNILYIAIILLLSSCFKEEDKRNQIGGIDSISMKLGEDYANVFYYNLNTQKIVSQNLWSDWDLAFYAQADQYYIKLSDGANMKAYNTQNSNFEAVTSLDPNWKSIVDDATGNLNNLALQFEIDFIKGDSTFYKPKVYVLLLGSDALGNELGYKKFTLLYTYLNQYAIKFSNLDNSETYTSKVLKDVTVNYVHFKFDNGGKQLLIEPDKSTWDIVFTRSTDITITNDFTDTIFDYSVTSVLLNQTYTRAYLEKEIAFDDISTANINNSAFTNQLNIIGYDFKAFSLTTGVYTVRKDISYVVKDINDFYYKIKFTDFYDPDTNLKGTISFTYEIL